MAKPNTFSLTKLLASLPVDAPVDLRWLAAHGVRDGYAAKLARSGYLRKLGSGTYCAANARLGTDACVAWLQVQVPHMHVASTTALAWRGIRHHLSFQEGLVLWGQKQFKVPSWFSEQFPVRHHSNKIFDESMSPSFGLQSAPGKPDTILVSAPERALLEMFSEIGTQVGIEEARNLTENARGIRREVLAHLLAHTIQTKVVRFVEHFGRELELPWFDLAQERINQMGISGRWVLSHPSSLQSISLKRPG